MFVLAKNKLRVVIMCLCDVFIPTQFFYTYTYKKKKQFPN